MRPKDFLRLLTCVMLIAVASLLLARKSYAGQFADLVAIVVATEDGAQVIPVDPVKISLDGQPKLIRAAARTVAAPVRTAKRIVCGPNGCREVEVPVAANCPCGPDCACDPCNCPTTPATPPPAAPQQQAIVTRAPMFNSDAAFMQRGPARRICAGILGRAKSFVVEGGPIRRALKSRRGR